MRNYWISGSKYFILGVIFLVTVIITFISMKFEQIMPSATTMADATLPTVAMDTEAGTQYNVLHGYTSELDSTLFYGNITPVAKDRKLTVTINTYGEDIEGVAYKIRSLEDKSLIENTEVSDYDNAGSSINVTFNIKNLLDTGKEYALEVVLKTKKHEANRTIADETLSPVMDYGILKERFAAIATDGARAKLLESKGYQTQILEFIDMEHTPKNLLIRAVKTGKPDAKAYEEVQNMSRMLNIDLTLKKLLED